jgi:hypothetical protein
MPGLDTIIGQAAPAQGTSLTLEPFDPKRHKPQDVGKGGLSTELLATEKAPDGKFWNIPTVWWDKEGKPLVVDVEQAWELAREYEQKTGRRFPRFKSIDEGVKGAKKRSGAGGASQGSLAR